MFQGVASPRHELLDVWYSGSDPDHTGIRWARITRREF